MFSPPGPLTINPLLYSDVAFDPTKFVPITLLARVPNVLIIRNNCIGVGAGADRPRPRQSGQAHLRVARGGLHCVPHRQAPETTANIAMVHVPYRGAAPALNDIVAGHVDMMFDTIVTSSPLHRAGTAKISGRGKLGSVERLAASADDRRIRAANFRSITWFAAVAPPGTPPVVAEKINKDVVEIIRRPDVGARLREHDAGAGREHARAKLRSSSRPTPHSGAS